MNKIRHQKRKKYTLLITTVILLISLSGFTSALSVSQNASPWAKESIKTLSDLQVLDQRLFSHYQGQITRGEFAYLGLRMYEILTGNSAKISGASFSDTNDPELWRAKSVGVINGYPDGSFLPNNLITRDELAVMFIRTLKASNYTLVANNLVAFNDQDRIGSWALESVQIARAYGFVDGVGQNLFNPRGTSTREQALTIFLRILNQFAQKNQLEAARIPQTSLPSLGQLKVGDLAPLFTLEGQSQKTVALKGLSGKPVVIQFFASWSTPCLEQMTSLETLKKTYTKHHYLAINATHLDTPQESIKIFQDLKLSSTLVFDYTGSVTQDYGITKLPTTVLVDSKGRIAHILSGTLNETTLENHIKNLK
jgi:peroxiredoxin